MKITSLNPWHKSPGMSEEELRALADKYLEGDTTGAEEERLRQYFCATDTRVPDDLRYLKALFAYEVANRRPQRDGQQTQTATHRRIVATWIAAAASVALLAYIALPQLQWSRNYAVIDGQRCVSHEVVMQEAESMLDMVSYSDDSFNALDLMQSPEVTSD